MSTAGEKDMEMGVVERGGGGARRGWGRGGVWWRKIMRNNRDPVTCRSATRNCNPMARVSNNPMSRQTRQLSPVFSINACADPLVSPSRATRLLRALRTLQIPCHPFRKRTSGRWKGSRSLGVLRPVNHYAYIRARWKGKHRGARYHPKLLIKPRHHVTVTQILVIRMTSVNIPIGNLNRQNNKHQYAVQLQQNHRN